ncbi:hypothetical protein NY547_13160 [Cnuibacter physcomitrellae]|uniref:hypothetical protein n=1 Tax=Cnuibacter physcomitrellae TaxID=1619308 RepID=UPI0021759673|nr:hypothetical protein [Cnuibacter physcomitrellae]MCS5498193.1 hypothetical protein [Cnuibacter physcomitrellae]
MAKDGKDKEPKRRKRSAQRWAGSDREVEPPHLKAAEDAIDDGVRMIHHALVLALKNRLIVSALRDGEPYSAEHAIDLAQQELDRVVAEQQDSARVTRKALRRAKLAHGRAMSEHDYGQLDVEALELRALVNDSVAERFAAQREDKGFLSSLIEESRGRAWDELGGVVRSRLVRAASIADDPGYAEARAERMREVAFDLGDLAVRPRS